MTTTSVLCIQDLSEQIRFQSDLSSPELSPDHTIGQALDRYLDVTGVRTREDSRWMIFSRGLRLDKKLRLRDLEEADARWTAIPEVSAG